MRKTNVTDDEVGGLAYETYCKAVGGKSFNGDPLPTWAEMKKAADGGDSKKENIVLAWKKAGRAVATLVEKKLPPAPPVVGVIGESSPPFAVTGAMSGRMSSGTGPNLSSLPAVSSMPPPIRNLKTRTKCCGSHSLSLAAGGKYVCPCGDTALAPEEINERA